MPYDADGRGQPKKRSSRFRIAAAVLLGAVVAFVYPIISAYYGVPPLYNHAISGNLLAKYYLNTKTEKLPGACFRFTSKYIHDGDEELVFDTVVACSTQVSSRATGSSVLSGMTPNLFAKRTRNNNAVLVVTPDLCSEANRGLWDDLPKTFIPITVWFENAEELTFGLAYVSEDAYESPKSHLKFVSAKVEPATREDWEAWWANRPENMVRQDMILPRVSAPRKDWERYYAFWPGKQYFADTCRGVIKLKLSEKTREKVRAHWPEDRPRYWAVKPKEAGSELRRYLLSEATYFVTVPGEYEARYIWHSPHRHFTVSSRTAPGGTTSKYSTINIKPAEYYPQMRDDYYPFLLSPEVDKKREFSVRVDSNDPSNRGFFACFNGPASNAFEALDYYLPSGRSKPTNAYINGVKVRKEGFAFSRSYPMQFVFERDTHLYRFTHFPILPHGGVE